MLYAKKPCFCNDLRVRRVKFVVGFVFYGVRMVPAGDSYVVGSDGKTSLICFADSVRFSAVLACA